MKNASKYCCGSEITKQIVLKDGMWQLRLPLKKSITLHHLQMLPEEAQTAAIRELAQSAQGINDFSSYPIRYCPTCGCRFSGVATEK